MNEQQLSRKERRAQKRQRREGQVAELQLSPNECLQLHHAFVILNKLKSGPVINNDRYYIDENLTYERLSDDKIRELHSKLERLADLLKKQKRQQKPKAPHGRSSAEESAAVFRGMMNLEDCV